MIFKYKLHCNTESMDKNWYLPNTSPPPTTCPTNSSHTIDQSSVEVESTGDGPQQVVQVLGQDALSLNPRGMMFTANANATSIHDLQLDTTLVLRGGVLYSENASVGDYMSVSIVDDDNLLGQGAGFVLGEYVKKWFVMPGQINELVDVSISQVLMAGLYVRVTYTSVTATAPTVLVNFISYVSNS